ncbi:hypothetical protein QQ045_011555 [Rhodiola kirilowii]
MIGRSLMPDLSGGDISLHYLPLLLDVDAIRGYSWGSAVLAYLYRQLCVACEVNHKQIGGCLILLQLWAWERMYVGRPLRNTEPLPPPFSDVDPLRLGALGYNKWHGPRSYTESPSRVLIYYRDQLDRQRKNDVIWTPYDEESLQMLNPICTEGRELWTAEVPLICYNIVEWVYPSRVLRQFGCRQIIPPAPRTNHHELHRITRKKYGSIVEADREEDDDSYLSDYFDWYYSVTRKFIQPRDDSLTLYRPNAHEHSAYVRSLVRGAQHGAEIFFNNPPPSSKKLAYDLFHLSFDELVGIGEERALDIDPMLVDMSDDDAQVDEPVTPFTQSQVTHLHTHNEPKSSRGRGKRKKKATTRWTPS